MTTIEPPGTGHSVTQDHDRTLGRRWRCVVCGWATDWTVWTDHRAALTAIRHQAAADDSRKEA